MKTEQLNFSAWASPIAKGEQRSREAMWDGARLWLSSGISNQAACLKHVAEAMVAK